MEQKYRVDIGWSEEDGVFIARVPELDGVVTHGVSMVDAAKNAEEAIELHLESLKAHKEQAPDPVALKKLSGNYALRMGKDRHEKLVIESTKQDISLNELLVTMIDKVFRSDTIVSTPRRQAVDQRMRRADSEVRSTRTMGAKEHPRKKRA